MTLSAYLQIISRRKVTALLGLLVGLVSALALYAVRPVEYTATLTMYVSAQAADTPQSAYQGAQLSAQRVSSYTELVNSPRVTQQVTRELGLTEPHEQLSQRIDATSPADSVIINVGVTDRDPSQAARIANAVGGAFVELVRDLERPARPDAVAPVEVRIVLPASPPGQPSTSGIRTALATGLIVGVVLAAASILTRELLDNSIQDKQRLSEASRSPLLGNLSFEGSVETSPLAVALDSSGRFAEDIRKLRTNLQFVAVDLRSRVLMISSALPSEGKTTTAINLALSIANAGSRVLLVDADLRRPRVCDLLGLDGSTGLTTVLSGRLRLQQAIQPWGGGILDVLGSGQIPPNPSELLGSSHMKGVLGELGKNYDFVVVDSAPILPVADSTALAPHVDGVILVGRFRRSRTYAVSSARQNIDAVGGTVIGCVLTMDRLKRKDRSTYGAYYGQDSELDRAVK